MSSLKTIQALQSDLGIAHESRLARAREDILKLTRHDWDKAAMRITDQVVRLEGLATKLEWLENEHETSCITIQVVKSLYFQEVRRRFDQIPQAEQLPNEWIFDPQLIPLRRWLESKTPDSNIFYIYRKVRSSPDIFIFEPLTISPGWKWEVNADEIRL
jgi:hypothetical protein